LLGKKLKQVLVTEKLIQAGSSAADVQQEVSAAGRA